MQGPVAFVLSCPANRALLAAKGTDAELLKELGLD